MGNFLMDPVIRAWVEKLHTAIYLEISNKTKLAFLGHGYSK
jgi:hypothetical protein